MALARSPRSAPAGGSTTTRGCTSWRRRPPAGRPSSAPSPEALDRLGSPSRRDRRRSPSSPRRRAAVPGDVGRDPDRRARRARETATSASARLGPAPPGAASTEDPVDAGRQVDGRRALAGRAREGRGAAVGIPGRPLRHQLGADEAARRPGRRAQRPVAGARESPPPIRSATRAPRSTAPTASRPQRRPLRALAPCSRSRKSLISLPVSIPTGHASTQLPSAAQVSMPSYSYCSQQHPLEPASPGAGAPSRAAATIRWRGVVVSRRLGHTGSQKPHSTQVSATSSIGGFAFRFRRCALGVAVEHHARRQHARRGRRAA